MKFKKFMRILKTSVLLLMTGLAFAQTNLKTSLVPTGGDPDLTFNFATTASDYAGSPLTTVSIDFQIQNILFGSAFAGVDFLLTYNDSEFFFNSGASTIDTANGWSCTPETGGLRCSTLVVAGGYDFVSTLAFDVGSTTAANTYPFNGALSWIGGVEPNTINNAITTGITIGAGSPPNLSFSGVPNPLDVTEGVELNTTVFYEVTNSSATPAGAQFSTFTVDFDSTKITFDSANVDPTPFDTCTAVGNTVTCNCMITCGFSDFDMASPVTIGLPFLLDDGIMTPTPANTYSFSATLSNSNIVPNPITTTKTLNVLPAASPPDLKIELIDIDSNPSIMSLDYPEGSFLAQTAHFRVTNNISSGPATNGAALTFFYDDFNFSLSDTTLPPGWFCTVGSPGQLDCNSINLLSAGDSLDFFFDYGPVQSLTAGAFATLDAAVDDNDFAEESMTQLDNFISVPVSVFATTDLELNKFTKDVLGGSVITNVDQGTSFIYSIQVNNLSTVAASNVTVTDNIPAGIMISSAAQSDGNWNCTVGSFVDQFSSQLVTCNRATVPANQPSSTELIVLDAVGLVPGAATITNTATITALDELDSNTGNNSDTSTVVVDFVAGTQTVISVNIDVVKSGVIVSSVSSGSDFTYRVAIENTGLVDANMIDLIDEMPSGVNINSITGAGWTCTNSGLDQLCDFPGPLVPGATTFLNFNVTESGSGAVLTNIINAQAANAPLVNDFVNLDVTNVTLDVNIMQNPNPIEEGQPFDFIIDIVNTGSEEIIGPQVVNTLPEGFSYTNQSKSSTCVVSGQDITCTVDNPIAIGATETISIGVQAIATSGTNVVYTNTTTVSGTNIPTPVVVQTSTNVNPMGVGSGTFNYTVALNDSSDPNEVNTPFDYIVTIENTGSSHITFMDVNVGIPAELNINTMLTNEFTCTSASFGLSCNSDSALDIAPGDSLDIITVNVQSNSFVGDVLADVMANLGTILQRSDEETTTIINTQVVVLNPDISVEIIAGNAIDQGAVSEFEVKIANSGPDVAEDVVLDMSLSGIIDSVSVVDGSEWTCQVSNFNVNCQFNDDTMPVNHQSSIFVSAATSQVVIEAENLILSATLTTSSSDIDLSNNTTSSQVAVSGTPTEGEIGDALRGALGGSGNPQIDSAIDGISGFCEVAYYTAIGGLCSDLYAAALDGEGSTVRNAIEQIMPNEVIGQSTSVSEIATAQFRNIGARLSQVRGGGGSGFSSAGLNARYGNGSIPLGMRAYLNQTVEETNGIDTNNDFISPWGFFVNGTISMGERDATSRELAFDFDTFGITAGVDYRLDAKKVIGVALGYANFDSKIENVSEIKSSGVTLTGYGSFYVTDNFYVDTRISYARPDFDQSRKIDFTLGSTHIDRTATGKTDADQYSMAISAGYSFYKNAWNITPNASISYVKTTIEEFTETGAGDFNFVYMQQDLDSLVWSAGVRVSKAISLKNGVITPQFDFDYNYEALNNADDIQTRFINAPDDQVLIVVTDSPDRSYGSAGLGLVYISANGKQAYINYRSVLGLEGFSRGTFNLGARFEF
jgi:uncharacterized repeat protein (TIGR01451 family)